MSETAQLRSSGRSDAVELIRGALALAADRLGEEGMARPELAGQLIRPVVALAGWRSLTGREPTAAFWWGVLAVQLAHEASLLHDDVVDGAERRRGARTLAASSVGAALVQGDHLLTTAYRCATRTESPLFVELFARAVERTVAGEIAQARAAGRVLTMREYETITRGKSGELLGCALTVAPALLAPARAAEFRELGTRFGVVYQMLDDLLDLSPATDTGKPSLADFAHRHWTWPLADLGALSFEWEPREIVRALYLDRGAGAPIDRSLERFSAEIARLKRALCERLGACEILVEMIEEWQGRAHAAVSRERFALRAAEDGWGGPSAELRARVPGEAEVHAYLARHSRSFAFATRFFSSGDGARVARVYAFCRCTDDLVDDPALDPTRSSLLLDEWLTLSRRAYEGRSCGLPFLERVMREMAAAGVPFRYVEELVEGMRMDLRGERYASLAELRRYTYRVASVVGLWISELFGVRDPGTLRRAEAMGHAMQLTNIIRDVGEDARAGRCYLPADLLRRHEIDEAWLARAEEPSTEYAALVEELIVAAEAAYAEGFSGIAELPRSLRLPVSVAAQVYRGILDEVRAKSYDNLRHRARTSSPRKAVLAAQAMLAPGVAWSGAPGRARLEAS